MSANNKNQDLPRVVCTHCYLSTRADMPKCLYCGTPLHRHPAGSSSTRRPPAEAPPQTEMAHRARATLSRWR